MKLKHTHFHNLVVDDPKIIQIAQQFHRNLATLESVLCNSYIFETFQSLALVLIILEYAVIAISKHTMYGTSSRGTYHRQVHLYP